MIQFIDLEVVVFQRSYIQFGKQTPRQSGLGVLNFMKTE
jgi:hypothetical protein